MPRKQGKAVPEGNDPVPHYDEFGSDEPTMGDLYRMLEESFDRQLSRMKSHFDRQNKMFDELTKKMRASSQRLAGLQHEARQPRLATEADVKPDKSRSTIEEGGDTMIPSPGRSPKQPLPGIGLHDPLHGREACPEFNSFNQRVGQIYSREGLFSYRLFPKRGRVCYIPAPPQSLNDSQEDSQAHGGRLCSRASEERG